ncbi:DUF4232 domain-containing protein [Streptomyces sp. NPDC048484]|uniref:DUF4232 domain-containing protein n=1 Tax=Streptomyces sp. NPDC048484 TaxID=3155146 RepID=UPI00342D1CCA
MSARTTRTRLLAAAALTVATLSLTACGGGDGVRDEGASSGSSVSSSSKGNEEASTGKGQADTVGSDSKDGEGDKGTQDTAAPSGTSGSTGTSGSGSSSGSSGAKSSKGSSGSKDSLPGLNPCATVRTTATEVSRPLNHILLTVTNTGSKNCHLPNYPAVRFGGAQSVPPVFEESQPQAVVTLAPGESGYAGVLLSAADGSGSNGYTAKSLTVYLSTDSKTAVKPSLPSKGVYVDDSIRVSYWQASMDDALAW